MEAKKQYDYLIVGAGLYGAMFAYNAKKKGKRCLVIDRDKIGGFCRTEKIHNIDVHMFGAHIFRTNRKDVWDFVNSIDRFVPFVNSPLANYKGEIYNLPFNMNTFHQLFGVVSPKEAKKAIEADTVKFENPKNLKEHMLTLVGKTIYEKLIKEYTEKQWGKKCEELPPSIMKRIPLRFTYDNNYYNEIYQGIPMSGYTHFFEKLLEGIPVYERCAFTEDFYNLAEEIIYTGSVDELFDYKLGRLEYRSVEFEHVVYEEENRQGNAVVNYTSHNCRYTRSIEHKHFLHTKSPVTVVSYEYPCETKKDKSPSYPINDERNTRLYNEYIVLAKEKYPNMKFGGRLGEYKYYSMNDIIEKFVWDK